MQLSPKTSRLLLDIARDAIRAAVQGRPVPAPPAGDPELSHHAGCFVSLHELRTHRLRGCVGQLDAGETLAVVVPKMAQACLHDPRFERWRIESGDLPRLQIEISLLSPPQPCVDVLDFDPQLHGIVLRVAERSGCFLPQVARETGWSREQLLSRLASEKLELDPLIWRSPAARLEKFTTLLIGPEPFDPMP